MTLVSLDTWENRMSRSAAMVPSTHSTYTSTTAERTHTQHTHNLMKPKKEHKFESVKRNGTPSSNGMRWEMAHAITSTGSYYILTERAHGAHTHTQHGKLNVVDSWICIIIATAAATVVSLGVCG